MNRGGLPVLLFLLLFLATVGSVVSQDLSTLREKTLIVSEDTTIIDSLPVVPGSVRILSPGLYTESYRIDTLSGLFLVTRPDLFFKDSDSVAVTLVYRVFNVRLNIFWPSAYDWDGTYQEDSAPDFFSFDSRPKAEPDFMDLGQLQRSGAITRGFSVGNRQDLSMSSNMDLRLEGPLTSDIMVRAAITDHNIPVQPEGTTQQIQDFDRVFITLEKGPHQLSAGDLEFSLQEDRFLRYQQKAQGIQLLTRINTGKDKDHTLNISAGAALSKGKYARNQIEGMEGNQGPYSLKGNNNERFIIVLSGSERVFVNGEELKRGEGQDYIINYNTAEITFTPSVMITKDSRIVAEFEYADRNYARSMFAVNTDYETDRLELSVNYFNQSDLKNQPYDMELNDTIRDILSRAGDDPMKAVIPGIEHVPFSSDMILYKMIDSLGYDSILVYSTNPDSARYRVRFTHVGQSNGHYVMAQTAANGRVYQWVKPSGGIPQGEYMPVRLLATPEKKEVLSLSASYKVSPTTRTGISLSASNRDKNLFSEKDQSDNKGLASEMWISRQVPFQLPSGTSQAFWQTHASLMTVHRHFSPVSRFRSTEFERDWHLEGPQAYNELTSSIRSALALGNTGNLSLSHQYLQRGDATHRHRYSSEGQLTANGYFFGWEGSLLQGADPSVENHFLRHYVQAGKRFRHFSISLDEDYERSVMSFPGDSIGGKSFGHQAYGAEVASSDTGALQATLRYEHRKDQLPSAGSMHHTSTSNQLSMRMQWQIRKGQSLTLRTGLRQLEINDTISPHQPEKSLNTRVRHSGQWANGAITAQTFYESGSGMEVKKDYTYMEVSPGQGVYQWIDYNNNGIKERDEFEVATFQDQANYIRVYVPTDDYIRVFTNQFSEVLTIRPSRIWQDNDELFRRIVSRFSSRTTYRVLRKNQHDDPLRAYNPFYHSEDEEALITLNEQLRNVIYFQRNHAVFGMHWEYGFNNNKTLLANGREWHEQGSNRLHARWNISPQFRLLSLAGMETRLREREFFQHRSFHLKTYLMEHTLSYQPSTNLRVSGSIKGKQKENMFASGESANIYDYGVGLRHSSRERGTLQVNFSWLNIDYGGDSGGHLEYEMLRGFKSGNNYRWIISLQRRLTQHLQLDFQYDGRKTPDANTIHTGRIQIRATF